MGPEEQLSWKDEALDFLLQAIAGDPSLRQMLVFKGARILMTRYDTNSRACG